MRTFAGQASADLEVAVKPYGDLNFPPGMNKIMNLKVNCFVPD